VHFARFRLSTQLLILTLGTAIAAVVLLVVLAVFLSVQVVQIEGSQRLTSMTEAAAELISAPLAAQDRAAVTEVLTSVVRDEGLDRAVVLAPDGTTIALQGSDRVEDDDVSAEDRAFALSALQARKLRTRNDTDGLIDMAVPLMASEAPIGVLLGQSSTNGAADELVNTILPRMSAAGLGVLLLAGLIALAMARYLARPLSTLTVAARAVGQGQLTTLPAVQGSAEVGALAGAFGRMVTDLRASQAAIATHQQTLEAHVRERTSELEQALAALQESVDARDQLSATVRDLASPIIPVLDGVVVMPLIGIVDESRAAIVLEALLRGVEQYRATLVILDVTGVPLIDTHVARVLVDAARAVKLLGTDTILVGVRPELAETIVGLGLSLTGLRAEPDLQRGLHYALRAHDTHVLGSRS
jgi:anti-anti-sigma regulatory factor/HAMP domain-containing protein